MLKPSGLLVLNLPNWLQCWTILCFPESLGTWSFNLNMSCLTWIQFSSVQSLSGVPLLATPWITACQAPLSSTSSQSSLKFMSIELVMPSNHLIIYHPLLLLPTIFPSIRVFFNESVLYIRWPKYWSFSFSINLSKEYSGLISFRMDWLDLLAVQGPKPVQGT